MILYYSAISVSLKIILNLKVVEKNDITKLN
jgi:hypothetical protein